jgi:thiamine-phosphate pyrophosphorylase
MPATAARKVAGKDLLIGVSTHSVDEARSAELDGADFITYGPIFETPSKKGMGDPVGKESIRDVQRAIDIPIFALGGIKSGDITKVMAAGATGVAMISAVITADDIKKAARKCMNAVDFMDRIACTYCTPR